jgi:hypothetical protein
MAVDNFRRQQVFAGAVTVSGTTPLLVSNLDVLQGVFALMRVLVRVTTSVTVAPAGILVDWREDPGTGAFTNIASFEVPIATADAYIEHNVERSPNTTAEAHTSQPTDSVGFLIGSQLRNLAAGLPQVGPGGEIQIISDGLATAGAADFWLDILRLPVAGTLPSTIVTRAVAT